VILVGVNRPNPLFRVPAAGGSAVPATALAKGETAHKWPQFLPDRRHFLYLRVSNDPNQSGVYVGSLDAKPEEQSLKRLLATNREAYYAAPPGGGLGHLIFLRDTTLMAQPFDPGSLELSGEPVPIAEGVDSFAAQLYGLFSVSDNGTIVYRGGAGSRRSPVLRSLVLFDPQGNQTAVLGDSADYVDPDVSPDGTRIAAAVGLPGSRDIWIVDATRNTNTRFTFDPANDTNPVWSPDGKTIVFASNRDGTPKPYVKRVDGTGEERLLADTPGVPTSWSKDGRFLLLNTGFSNSLNIVVLRISDRLPSESNATALLATRFNEGAAQFSPDGRWIAYTSNESSTSSIYVQPFLPEARAGTGGGAKWLISKGLGLYPRWSSDGRQLFYVNPTNLDLMAVDIDTSKSFQAGTPRRLFSAPPPSIELGWDVLDNKRFLFVATPNSGRPAPFTVMVNWAVSLRK
jgi:Tol biopolymer transport system component